MSDNETSNCTDTVCSIGGRLYYYDACGETANSITADCYIYIGSGTIYSIDGTVQIGSQPKHFWRYNDRTRTVVN